MTGVLFSAGLDSAVLLAAEARRGPVLPIYITEGLAWEAQERAAAERVLQAAVYRGVAAPAWLSVDVRDVYPASHWALTGTPPAYDTPDEDVYLVGRNVLLLSKAAVFCATRRIERMAIGPLAGNPFPDATPRFFTAMAEALSLGLDHRIDIVAPLAALHKADVIGMGEKLGVPLELTLSCMNPRDARHCGACSKCRERQHAFRDAGVVDRTIYLSVPDTKGN
jgi:7-cyano-7-deazaguanine synthase